MRYLLLFFVFGACNAVGQAPDGIYLDHGSGFVGDTVTVWINVPADTIQSFGMTISTDSLIAMPIAIVRSASLNTWDAGLTNIFYTGIARVAFANAQPRAVGGRLFGIVYRLVNPGQAAIRITYIDIDEQPLPVIHDGSVIVEEPIVWGDVTSDGLLDIDDATRILQHVIGLKLIPDQKYLLGDTSGNEAITPYDASLILAFLRGYISCFPIEATCNP